MHKNFTAQSAGIYAVPDLGRLLREGFSHHQAGRLPAAAAAYAEVLKHDPVNFDARNLLGLALVQQGRAQEGVPHLQEAARLQPDNLELWSNLGNVYRGMNELAGEAQALRNVIRLRRDADEAYGRLGQVAAQLGHFVEAELLFRHASVLNPQSVAAFHSLAQLAEQMGRWDEARQSYERAAALLPESVDILAPLGRLLERLGDDAAAADVHQRLAKLQPNAIEPLELRSAALFRLGRFEEAESCLRRLIELQPQNYDAQLNLGNILRALGRYEEAAACSERAIAIDGSIADGYVALAGARLATAPLDDVEPLLRRALAINPQLADARVMLSQLLLWQGRFAEGWPYYEARYAPDRTVGRVTFPNLPFPVWQGEPLTGKRLLVVGEQGLGDKIQMARFLPQLRERGAVAVDVLADRPLCKLLALVPGVTGVAPEFASARYDYWVPMMSLPLRFQVTEATLPGRMPYITVDPQRADFWKARLAGLPRPGLRVGFTWATAAQNRTMARFKTVGLAGFGPLLAVDGVVPVSLQYPVDEIDRAGTDWPRLMHWEDEIQDFAEMAALISQLDLVVTVDTAVAHVAGALGRPVWVLLPANCDWRWMLDRTDTPWYPTMRLFRQRQVLDWGGPLNEIAVELAALASRQTGA